MKLFSKYSRTIVSITMVIFFLTFSAFYITLKHVQLKQIEADLEIEEEEIQQYVRHYGFLPKMMSVQHQLVQFDTTVKARANRHFQQTSIADQKGQKEAYYQLIFAVQVLDRPYRVTVSKSLKETDHLITSTLWVTLFTILVMLISFLLINRFVLRKLWKPFFLSLEAVRSFTLNKTEPLQFPVTNIEEFLLMNHTLQTATDQAKLDYLSLKTFSENASHEIQTPIAIVRSKIDLLIQDESLTEKQSQTLQAIAASVQRLSRINSSLLLLAKIENGQFADQQTIALRPWVEEKLADFQELWEANGLLVNQELQNTSIIMNKELLHFLLNNLFSNATRHNNDGGQITVKLGNENLHICNTSLTPMLDERQLYQRFYKPAGSNRHNGLGLSIIRQICDASDIEIKYQYVGNMHCFELSWNRNP